MPQFATPSQGSLSDSPPLTQKQAHKYSPNDKPLPSTPVLRLESLSPRRDSKSLIDASEKPLRYSPTGIAGDEEDWPVLRPQRSIKADVVQQMKMDASAHVKDSLTPNEYERFPRLANNVRHIPSADQLPISRYSTHLKAPPKELASVDSNEALIEKEHSPDDNSVPLSRKISIDDPFRDGVYNKNLTSPIKTKVTPSSKAPSNDAAVQKAGQDVKPSIEPRQTRTSSLRARLSAGQLVKNDHSKVTGFTDFTAPKDSGPGVRRNSFKTRREAQARRSITPPAPLNLHRKASKDSIGGGRAPAQFVAGSRRPTHPRRPSSRNSLHSDAAATQTLVSGIPPGRAAPTRPGSQGTDSSATNSTVEGQSVANVRTRASAIPVPRQTNSPMDEGHNRAISVTSTHEKLKEKENTPPKKEARDEASIYDDASFSEFKEELKASGQDISTLEAIEESPQHDYKLKRLSMHSPEYGPTLRISPSADRFIMGPDVSKHDTQLKRKKSREYDRDLLKDERKSREHDRSLFKNELKGRKSNPNISNSAKEQRERLPRQLSSQGISHLATRVGLNDHKAREKKVKSADLSLASPKIFDEDTKTPTQKSFADELDTRIKASHPSTSTTNDPFFDAQEQLGNIYDTYASDQSPDREHQVMTEEAWISPLKTKSSKPTVKQEPTATAPSEALIKQNGSNDHHDSTQQKAADPLHYSRVNRLTEDPNETKDNRLSSKEVLPSTPEQSNGASKVHSNSHPPRSSSRNVPPESVAIVKPTSSPPTASKVAPWELQDKENTPPPTPPKDLDSPKKKAVPQRGKTPSQASVYPITSQHSHYRDSAGQESYKSHGSMSKSTSKGVLSGIKGLFHKRSSDTNFEAPNTTKAKTGKTTKSKPSNVQPNGSPYPPISSIHPLHRPTAASLARAKANTPRASTTSSNRSSTPGPSTTINHPTNNNITPRTPITPSLTSPLPTTNSTATTLVMSLLQAARIEPNSPQKQRMIHMGQVLVNAIQQARDAELAMEEAKQGAQKAEAANKACQEALGEVTRCTLEWRREGRSQTE